MERIEIQIARKFHKVYEKLAPEFGYTTRPETREFDENSPNGKLMVAVCKEVMTQELDKAREEGKREALEQIQRFVEDEMLVITRDGTDILEKYIKEWLSKLTTK